MVIQNQFRVKNSLDNVLQLIYISSNLFSTFELNSDLGILQFNDTGEYSHKEQIDLLIYFLDLVEYFSQERLYLIKDATDRNRYALTGINGGN